VSRREAEFQRKLGERYEHGGGSGGGGSVSGGCGISSCIVDYFHVLWTIFLYCRLILCIVTDFNVLCVIVMPKFSRGYAENFHNFSQKTMVSKNGRILAKLD
jgi:hypothetical protein